MSEVENVCSCLRLYLLAALEVEKCRPYGCKSQSCNCRVIGGDCSGSASEVQE